MLRRGSVAFCLALCLLGTGAQWDVLQIFAWGRMIAEHARTMSLAAAVDKTFDGEMCGMCRLVAKARQRERSQSNQPEARDDGRVVLFFQAQTSIVSAPPRIAGERAEDSALRAEIRSAPPTPPPRQAAA